MGNKCSKKVEPTEVTHERFVINKKEETQKRASTEVKPKTLPNDPDLQGTTHLKDNNEEESSIQPLGEVLTEDTASVCNDEPHEPLNLPSDENPPLVSETKTSSPESPSSQSKENHDSPNATEIKAPEKEPEHVMAKVKVLVDDSSDDSQSDDNTTSSIPKEKETGARPKEPVTQSVSTNSNKGPMDTQAKLELIKQTIPPIINTSVETGNGPDSSQSRRPKMPQGGIKFAGDPVEAARKISREPIHPSLEHLEGKYEGLVKSTQEQNFMDMKKSFFHNPDEFLTQNLALAVQFVRNYEKDKETLNKRKRDTEDELRDKLSDMKQHAIISNQLFQLILDYVGYETKVESGTILEPIQPVEFFLVNQCVEVLRPQDTKDGAPVDYSQLDAPVYRTRIEETKKKGYVKLRCLDNYESLAPSTVGGSPPVTPRPPIKNTVSPKIVIDPPTFPKAERALTPTSDHGRFHFARPNSVTVIEELDEDDESDEDAPTTGQDFLRSLRQDLESNPNSPIWNTGGRIPPIRTPETKPQNKKEPTRLVRQPESPPSPPPPAPPPPVVSLYESAQEEEIYGYGMNNPEKLVDFSTESFKVAANQNALDRKCFKRVKCNINDNVDDDDDEDFDPPTEERTFVHSKYFSRNFKKKGPNLAHHINLPNAGWFWDHYRLIQRQERTNDFEHDLAKEDISIFIPTVEVGYWPADAFGWYLNKVTKMIDKRTRIQYYWPRNNDKQFANAIGCNLVPIGYMDPKKDRKKASNENSDLRLTWRLSFTKMEYLIMKNWSHPKVRCYIFLMLFQKALFQSSSGESWLRRDHFRHILFKIMQDDPVSKWAEENLGKTLREIFIKLKASLYHGKLPNYFVRKQNMLDTLSPQSILKAKEILIRLEESFASFFMWCIDHLKAAKNFYPMPDVKKLYDILVADKMTVLMRVNPALGKDKREANVFTRETTVVEVKKTDRYKETMLNKLKANEEKRKREEESKMQPQDTLDPTRPDYPLLKIEKFDSLKGGLVLDFFVEHFIKMAVKSNENRCYGQGLMYVMHCENLTRLRRFVDGSYNTDLETAEKIELLKQVTRGKERDYWKMNYDPEDGLSASSSFSTGAPRMHREVPLPSIPINQADN